MLKTQYRMHPFLLEIPNHLFYGGEIEDEYKKSLSNKFISEDYPFLFINTNTQEKSYGTSHTNKGEAQIILKLMKYFINVK